ncbi:glucan biosynthesis protein [Phragmitibacter flavus]|uniref:Glucan biosynthesis protein n=1 Tax=Phragmitibacter flavus TaxID=2576071 RepID=A0A5R8K869_9BACT|nr:glucan biosynthesis protein [Phragmitibacter flavus]
MVADPGAPPPIRTFLDLEAYASKLASKAFVPQEITLDPFFGGLQYDGHRQIRFLKDKALFEDNGDGFRVEFSHPGWMFKKTVDMFKMEDGQPVPLKNGPEFFSYGDLKPGPEVKYPVGFSGWKLLSAEEGKKERPEFLTFQGASYFRAVTTKLGWGISARGVAINTIGGEPEEFPDFTHFWFLTPKEGDKTFQFLALLNGPSVTGAYHFEVQPGETTVMTVRSSLFMRKVVKMLGLAPFSSMFWYGENTHPKPLDFRPEVHDSDGLLIEQHNGPILWRPLDNGREMRHSVFSLEAAKGFGLLQRDRDFKHYQDLEANYHNRVSVWVEPVEGFGRGKLHLIELATGEETWDNIVSFWEPDLLPTATEPARFVYKLHWLKEHEHNLAKVTDSRWGEGVATMDVPNDYEFVIDFTKGTLKEGTPADWLPEEAVNIVGEAKMIDKRVMFNPQTGGWRAFFKLDIPPSTKLLEMTCELLQDGKPLSERWTYQWRR